MDSARFKQQFIPYYPKFYRVAYRLLGNVQDAEDAVQEAYLKLWEKRNDRIEMQNTEAYCITLVKNLCLDKLRMACNNTNECQPEELNLSIEASVIRQIEQRDEAAYVKKLIERLPEQQKRVVILRDLNDCSFEEMEKVTGLAAGNIRVLLSRARKTIREQFKKIASYECR